MTHEFKTPLSSIRIAAETFFGSPELKDNERLKRYATIIKEQADRLNIHVEKILNVARLENDQFSLKKENIDLRGLLEQIHEHFMPIFDDVSGQLDNFRRDAAGLFGCHEICPGVFH